MARHTQKVQMVDYINLSHFIHTVENDKANMILLQKCVKLNIILFRDINVSGNVMDKI